MARRWTCCLRRPDGKSAAWRAGRQQTGISLVEVLIALAVFSVGIMAILPMFLYSTMQVRMQKDKELATQIALDWAARLDDVAYSSLTQDTVNTMLSDAYGGVTIGSGNIGMSDTYDPNVPIKTVYSISIDIDTGSDPNTFETGDDPNSVDRLFTQMNINLQWRSLNLPTKSMRLSRLRLRNATW